MSARLKFNPIEGRFDLVGGSSTASPWARLTGTIGASTNLVVDTVSLIDMIGGKYLIAVSNATETQGKVLELNILNQTASIKDNVFGKINGGISVDVDVNINAGNMEVDITNNELFTINYNIVKTIFN